MYGSRAMLGNRGLLDEFDGPKRARPTESNPYFPVTGGVSYSSVYDDAPKRQRMFDSTNPYMTRGASSFYDSYNSSYNSEIGGIQPFSAVRLRGLPFTCDDLDISRFLAGLNIVDCLLVKKDGRFSGEAYVVLSSPMQAELAFQRDRQNMGRRYIEVFPCSKQDYYHAVAAEVNNGEIPANVHQPSAPRARAKKPYEEDKEHMEYTEILKLRGLPYSVTKYEIVDFFGEFDLKEENVRIARRRDGKASGEAFVEFSSAEVAKKAMCMDKMTIGTRYVELFPSTHDEAGKAEP